MYLIATRSQFECIIPFSIYDYYFFFFFSEIKGKNEQLKITFTFPFDSKSSIGAAQKQVETRVRTNYIFDDNVRTLCLSSNVKKFKTITRHKTRTIRF